MTEARLNDGIARSVEIVDIPEKRCCTERVKPKLRIARRVHLHALPVFEVDNLDCAAADDDSVACAEGLRGPRVEVKLLLYHELRVLARCCKPLHDRIRIEISRFVHLAAPVLAFPELLHLRFMLRRCNLSGKHPEL